MGYINAHGIVSIRTTAFNASLRALPEQLVTQASALYQRWSEGAPLKHKDLIVSGTWQAEINPRHRAIFAKMSLEEACSQGVLSERIKRAIDREMKDEGKAAPSIWIWHWVGTHETYNRLAHSVKRKQVLDAAINTAANRDQRTAPLSSPRP